MKKLNTLLLGLVFPLFCQAQPNSGGVTCTGFEEKNGLLVVEMENTNFSGSWKKKTTIGSATGSGYIQWEGPQTFNSTANGRIEIPIKINTPGTYEFRWRMAVGNTEHGLTEHNDTWLKIVASNFYAEKNTSLIKPKPDCNTATNYACPEGSSIDGFFKLFGGGTTWQWQNKTSDFDDHFVHATFNTPGDYKIIVAARSSFHALDRLVMYNKSTMSRATAENLANVETVCTNNGGGTVVPNIANLTATSPNCSTVVLTWSDVSGEDAYRVSRKTATSNYVVLADVLANSSTYVDETAEGNTSYQYIVHPMKGGVVAAVSNTPEILTAACPPSNIIDLVLTSTSCKSVNLAWSDVSGETGYRIRRKTATTAYVIMADIPANSKSYVDTTAAEQTTYQYMVRPMQGAVAVAVSNTPEILTAACPTDPVPVDTFLKAFPNPTTGILTLPEVLANDQIKVISQLSGLTVLSKTIQQSGSTQLNISNQPAGSYTIQLVRNNQLLSRVIIKL